MAIPRWFIDEVAHAGSEHLDASYVQGYDRKAGIDPAHDVAALRGLGLNETHTLIDIGAGTGSLTLAFAPYCRRVIAVDVSSVMLRVMRERAAQLDIRNIEFVQGGFLSYEHQGELADFIYSRHALHHLPDFWKALALQHMAGMLKTDGILYIRDLIFSFEPGEIEHVIEGWLSRAADDPEKGWTRAELETHLREEYSTFSWVLEPMIKRAGFEVKQAKYDASRLYAEYTCVKVG